MFATYPNEDYDRRNEDVDPMAASAEYELEKRVERLDLFPVELEKGDEQMKFKRKDVQSASGPVSCGRGFSSICLPHSQQPPDISLHSYIYRRLYVQGI